MRSRVDGVTSRPRVLIVNVGVSGTTFSGIELHIRNASATFAKRERMAPFCKDASVARHNVGVASVTVAVGAGVCGESAFITFDKFVVCWSTQRGRDES